MITTAEKNILICDDYQICCLGLRMAIEAIPSKANSSFHFAKNGKEALELASTQVFDYIFMDLKLPDLSGLETIERLNIDRDRTKVILFTSFDDPATARSLKSVHRRRAVHAILHKSSLHNHLEGLFDHLDKNETQTYLGNHISTLLENTDDTQLTKREMEVIHLVALGLTTREIAERLSCSYDTVKGHRANILLKAKVRNVAELAVWYSEHYGKADSSA